MKRMIVMVCVLVVGLLVSGCGTTGLKLPNSRSGGLAGAVKTVKPEYASAVDKVVELLVGKQPEFVNPVEGFQMDEIWSVDGKTVPASSVKKEVRYTRTFAASDVALNPAEPGAPASTPPAMDPEREARLRAEIEAIFKSLPTE